MSSAVLLLAASDPSDCADLPFGPPTTLPYLREYPGVHYEKLPTQNAVARLEERLERGEVKLEFREPRGYLDSLLATLTIDHSSQVLVYSKTSLQATGIQAATPRAIYFDEATYLGWVPQAPNIEVATMDRELGQVFYVLPNRRDAAPRMHRLTLECLSCHDTYELSGSGVPRFLLMSTYVDVHGNQLTHEGQIITSDQTELKYRWGGWYVTGQSGEQVHLGNIQVRDVQELVHLDQVRRGNLDTLRSLFDTGPYLTEQSDIVALLVLQHQVDVQNLITRVNFEAHAPVQKQLKMYMDQLVDAMLFVDAASFTGKITGNSGFARWFESRGPRDRQGRSLRQLDLRTRLFQYPLSYLVYSDEFDALPEHAKAYVYQRFAAILSGREGGDRDLGLAPDDRKALLQILTATKPEFARFVDARD